MGQMFDRGNMGKVDKVAVWVAEVGFHSTQTEDDVAVALVGQIFGRVQGLLQRDAEPPLDEHGQFALTANGL